MAIRGMIRGLLGNRAYELLRNCVRGESTGSQRSLDKHLLRAAHDHAAVASPWRSAVAPGDPLSQLGEKHGPTKRRHNYLPWYWQHFRDVREQVRTVVEIGVQTDRSLRMWEEFFPNAMILGVDIEPGCRQFEGGRRRILIGDQSDPAFLQQIVHEAGGVIDIVIDDGSHIVEHQLKTFDVLFPRLSAHGIYVVEDTGGVVGDFELRTVNALKRLIDHVMYWPVGRDPAAWSTLATFPEGAGWADRNVVGVAFYRWIVFVLKGRNPEDNGFLAQGADDTSG